MGRDRAPARWDVSDGSDCRCAPTGDSRSVVRFAVGMRDIPSETQGLCGRFTWHASSADVASHFGLDAISARVVLHHVVGLLSGRGLARRCVVAQAWFICDRSESVHNPVLPTVDYGRSVGCGLLARCQAAHRMSVTSGLIRGVLSECGRPPSTTRRGSQQRGMLLAFGMSQWDGIGGVSSGSGNRPDLMFAAKNESTRRANVMAEKGCVNATACRIGTMPFTTGSWRCGKASKPCKDYRYCRPEWSKLLTQGIGPASSASDL